MKKLASILIVMLASFALLATGSSESSSDGRVTITIGEHVANIETQSPHVAKIISGFLAENPDVDIQVSGSEVSEHLTKMRLAAQNDSLPDIIWLEQPIAKEMAAAGYLHDMTDDLESYGINDSLLPGLDEQFIELRKLQRLRRREVDVEPVEAELAHERQKIRRRSEMAIRQRLGAERQPADATRFKNLRQLVRPAGHRGGITQRRGMDNAVPGAGGARATGRENGEKHGKNENFQKKHRFPPNMPLK